MEDLICIDSSVLINHFREKIKTNTFFFNLSFKYSGFAIQPFVHFEIYVGALPNQKLFWDNIFSDFIMLPYSTSINDIAISVQKSLKGKGKNIEFKDLMIAATALKYKYALATINEKHFEHIDGLKLITPYNL